MVNYGPDLLAGLRQYQQEKERRRAEEPNWLGGAAGGLAGLLSGGGLAGAGLGALGGIGSGQGATGVAKGALTGYTYGSGLAKAEADTAEEKVKKTKEDREEKTKLRKDWDFKDLPTEEAKIKELGAQGWNKMPTPWGDRLARKKTYAKEQVDLRKAKADLSIKQKRASVAKDGSYAGMSPSQLSTTLKRSMAERTKLQEQLTDAESGLYGSYEEEDLTEKRDFIDFYTNDIRVIQAELKERAGKADAPVTVKPLPGESVDEAGVVYEKGQDLGPAPKGLENGAIREDKAKGVTMKVVNRRMIVQ